MPYARFSYNIGVGTDINTNVGFNPMAAICSNYSPYYIYLPDGYTYIAPWTVDVVIPLQHATQAKATWKQSPFGAQVLVAAPAGIVYSATLIFTDDPNAVLGGGTVIIAPLDTRSAVFTALPGATLTTGIVAFSILGVRVDNYTGTWYQIGTTGILVPPFTTGFTVNLIPPVGSIVLAPATPPYGPANNTTGTQVVLTLYATGIGNSAGTTAVIAAPAIKFLRATTASQINTVFTRTITFPAATAGNLLVVVFSAAANSLSTTSGPAGWTLVSTNASALLGWWIGYIVAVGGETTVTFTMTTAAGQLATSIIVGEYTNIPNKIVQSGSTATNTASVTPITSPSILMGVSAFANNASVDGGAVTSPNTIVRSSVAASVSAARSAAALGDLNFSDVSSKSATFIWVGGAAVQTGAMAGE